MVYRDASGELRVRFSRQEVIEILKKWRQKPETKEMIAKIATERHRFIDNILADARARKK